MKERDKYKLNGNIETYKITRNKVSSSIEQAKNRTYQTKIEEGKDDPKPIWKLFKEPNANGKGSNSELNINIKKHDKLVQKESELTELFNSYFVNTATNLKEPIISSDFETLRTFVTSRVSTNTKFNISLTNETFVRKFSINLNVNKSTGLDNIDPKILKLAANVLTLSLTFIVKIILSGEFPSYWKEAKVKSLFKSGAKDNINNYRPISILPAVSKLIEKLVVSQFSVYLNNFNLLHNLKVGLDLSTPQNLHLSI